MKKAFQGCVGLVVLVVVLLIVAAVFGANIGGSESNAEGTAAAPRPTLQPTATPNGAVDAGTQALAATAPPLPSPAPTATPTPTPTPRPDPTPTPVIAYAACDDVPTYLLRLDTQGRVAVQRELVPSQPDGDDDGFACGDQLEHKREWARSTVTPTTRPTTTARPCPTNAERRYIDALRTNMEEMGASAIHLAALLVQIEQDPGRLLSEEFQINFMLTGALAHEGPNKILKRSQPSSLRLTRIHERAREMARSYKDGLDGIVLGFRNLDEAAIERGARSMSSAESQIREVSRLLDRLCR